MASISDKIPLFVNNHRTFFERMRNEVIYAVFDDTISPSICDTLMDYAKVLCDARNFGLKRYNIFEEYKKL